jgi:hypothetical protein
MINTQGKTEWRQKVHPLPQEARDELWGAYNNNCKATGT